MARHYNRFRFDRHGFAPRRSWLWPYVGTSRDEALAVFDQGPAPAPYPVYAGIPSIVDLPVSAGIRSAPAAPPVVYVVNGRRSVRRGGLAKVETVGASEAELPATGPRIVPITVPRGR